MSLQPGLSGRAQMTVADADTARSVGSGDVAVLSTPRLVALCEEASFQAVQPLLAEGQTTVGNSVQFNHLSPTAVG
ncbi:MAG TPA: thioesterase, partial [Acidimicrobiales bacterium]|nr:thioesterase [Acidimicrobiales bacterium]